MTTLSNCYFTQLRCGTAYHIGHALGLQTVFACLQNATIYVSDPSDINNRVITEPSRTTPQVPPVYLVKELFLIVSRIRPDGMTTPPETMPQGN
jgi:hypothetical protein